MVRANNIMRSPNGVKTPHRIELCEEKSEKPKRTYRKRRIIGDESLKTENKELKAEPVRKVGLRSRPLNSRNSISNMTNGTMLRARPPRVARGLDSHKMTEYFKEEPKSPNTVPAAPSTVDKTANVETKMFNGHNAIKNEINDKIITSKLMPSIGEVAIDKLLNGDEKFMKNNSCVIDSKVINGNNHKLTEYFPVRRSVRKTSKCVMAEKMRDLERAVREQKEDGLQVTNFEGKGRGVVATRPFARGQFVVEYAGELVGVAEAREREAKYALDPNAGCYMYYFKHGDQQYCIDATAESGRLGRLVNHSRVGNLHTKAVWVDGPRLVLLAAHDIRPGDELTYDYGDRSKESLQHHPWLAL